MRRHEMSRGAVVETLQTSRRGLGAGKARRRLQRIPAHEQLLDDEAALRQAIHSPLASSGERQG